MIRLAYMYDTIKNSPVLQVFKKNTEVSSSEVAELINNSLSLVTVKRQLSNLLRQGYLIQFGAGRSVKYKLSKRGVLLRPVNAKEYLKISPDVRLVDNHYQFDIFDEPSVSLFDDEELKQLKSSTEIFRQRSKSVDPNVRKKELMRFIVEFSWKTSQIEGNSYDLISTERLLLYGEKSSSNTEFESQMIINQKNALDFIVENPKLWGSPNLSLVEKLHSYVSEGLGISNGFRKSLVGITGTNYRPLENEFQIREATNSLLKYINNANNGYEKALFSVLGLSYIQPFVDGNKRTSRLLGNAILINDNLAPLSYRSVDSRDYKEATLLFYEQNTIMPFKKIFIEQYIFSANNYNLGI
jgi:Fic family protein